MLGKSKLISCLVVGTTFLVSACSGGEVKRSLGLNKTSPDEFMVISRPPLSVPPDFRLDPPADAQIVKSDKTRDEAKEILFNKEKAKVNGGVSKGEFALLSKAQTDGANPNIREVLAKEEAEAQVIEEEKGMLESFREYLNPPEESVVDVDKEEDRLADNAAEGKPVNEGDVPTKDEKKKGVLNSIFGD